MLKTVNRKNWIDMSRAFGIFAIVYGHLVQGNSVISHFFGSFRVAIFFAVMGLTFRYQKGFVQFIKKKALRLMVPYYVFALISILIMAIIESSIPSLLEGKSASVWNNLWGALYANGLTGNMKWNMPLWFLPCSFVTLILVNGFESLIYRQAESRKVSYRLLFFFITIICNFVYCKNFSHSKLPFGAEVAISMSGFVELGILLTCLDRIPKSLCGFWGILFMVPAYIFSLENKYVSVMSLGFGNIALYYAVAVFAIVGSFLLSIWFCSLSPLKWLRHVVCYCGRHTLAILCMHKFPVLLFQLVIPYTKDLLRQTGDSHEKNIVGLLISMIIVVLCLAAEIPFQRYFPEALGNKRNEQLNHK